MLEFLVNVYDFKENKPPYEKKINRYGIGKHG